MTEATFRHTVVAVLVLSLFAALAGCSNNTVPDSEKVVAPTPNPTLVQGQGNGAPRKGG